MGAAKSRKVSDLFRSRKQGVRLAILDFAQCFILFRSITYLLASSMHRLGREPVWGEYQREARFPNARQVGRLYVSYVVRNQVGQPSD